jgi:hypothetical protein
MDGSVVAMLEDEALEVRGPPQQNPAPAIPAEPFLCARLRAAVKNHLVCLWH